MTQYFEIHPQNPQPRLVRQALLRTIGTFTFGLGRQSC